MPSRSWSRDDVKNLLAALLGAKLAPFGPATGDGVGPPPEEAARAYASGCTVATQCILVALGFSPELAGIPSPTQSTQKPHGVITQLWLLEDLENLITSLYASTLSSPPSLPKARREAYLRGFADICQGLLASLGSPIQLPPPLARKKRHWKEAPTDPCEG